MKKTLLVTLVTLFAACWQLQAQDDQRVLFSVNGDAVSAGEFLTVFNKNNYSQKPATQEDLQEYLDLYIKFKLKVQEAYSLGLDTSAKFIRELGNYRDQLAQPYLRDKESSSALVKEAYVRTTTERRASHIMVRVEENASPADSLAAYKKALDIEKRLKKGEDFSSLAREVSEDPSAADNAGDLGFFSAFRMIYPFEDMAYKTPIGQTSPIFRTQFGYHILKATDERPARGEIRVAHLMLVIRNTDTDSVKAQTKKRIMELYKKIQAGENFEQLVAQYSEDPSSSSNQGLLPYFGTGRMVPEFEEAAFGLAKDGDIAAPILTPYGWHIIKRTDKREVAPFEQMRAELEARVARDSRANINKANLIKKLKEGYAFQENAKAKQAVWAQIDREAYQQGSWEAPKPGKKNEVVFSFADQQYLQSDVAAYLQSKQSQAMNADLDIFLNKTYQTWIDELILKYEDAHLEEKYADFRALLKEYREGILLFDLTDQMVWSKAVTDTTGLQAYYAENATNYMYQQRVAADVFTAIDEKTAKAALKAAKKKKFDRAAYLAKVNKDNPLNLKISSGKFEAGQNAVVDQFAATEGFSGIVEHKGQWVFVRIEEVLPPSPKPLVEIRGLVTSDYQQYLEREWISELEKKYKVVVNQDTLNSLLN